MSVDIPLRTGGLIARVDECDSELVHAHAWYAVRFAHTTYARAVIGGKNIYLHRLLLGAERGQEVDHINHDGLDNRRRNLRLCTRSQNMANARIRNSTGYRGAYFDAANCRYRAEISVNGVRTKIGSFRTAIDAAKAYDEAAKRFHGEFATLNFPEMSRRHLRRDPQQPHIDPLALAAQRKDPSTQPHQLRDVGRVAPD